jgi:uncharacterized membrane protein YoaK (UPF0700 family)
MRDAANRATRLASLMFGLTFSTGVVDAASYLGLGHVFVANMTGNVVFIGLGASGHTGIPVLRSVLSLGGFLGGAAAAGYFLRRRPAVRDPLRHSAFVLAAISVTFGGLAIGLSLWSSAGPGYDVLTVPFAAAMGAQAAAARVVAVAEVSTVVVTSTLVALVADPWLGPNASPRTGRRLRAALSLAAGAGIGALLLRVQLWAPMVLATAVTAGAAALLARTDDQPGEPAVAPSVQPEPVSRQ